MTRDDEAFARLRAADPAAGLEPDLTALRRAVTERAGVADELSARRRRPSRAFQVAAACAGALAFGVGGYAIGSTAAAPASGGTQVSGEVAASVPAREGFGPGAAAEIGGSSSAMAAGGDRIAADTMIAPWPSGGRIVFTARGLSGSGGIAHAYVFDASVVDADLVGRIAEALGVPGGAREEEGRVVAGEEGVRFLSVETTGPGYLSYYDSAAEPWGCDENGECEERDLGEPPRGEAAREAALEVFAAFGLDTSALELEVRAEEGSQYTNVVARREEHGVTNQWEVSLTGGGVLSAWGRLAGLVDLGEYEVVSPAEAVERLTDPRFGATNVVYPADVTFPAVRELGEKAAKGGAGAPRPGDSFPWAVERVTITSAKLGLGEQWLDDGTVVHLPTYELSAPDGRSWSVLAVAEKHLDFGS